MPGSSTKKKSARSAGKKAATTKASPSKASKAAPAKKASKASKAAKSEGAKAAKRGPAPRAKTKVAPSELAQQDEDAQLRRRGRLPTGSLHAMARAPEGADELKARLTALMNVLNRVQKLSKNFEQNFFEIGEVLREVRDRNLYEVRGYSTLESFLDRETKLSPSACIAAIRIFETFRPEAAAEIGFARLNAGIQAVDGGVAGDDAGTAATEGAGRSPIPPHKL